MESTHRESVEVRALDDLVEADKRSCKENDEGVEDFERLRKIEEEDFRKSEKREEASVSECEEVCFGTRF